MVADNRSDIFDVLLLYKIIEITLEIVYFAAQYTNVFGENIREHYLSPTTPREEAARPCYLLFNTCYNKSTSRNGAATTPTAALS